MLLTVAELSLALAGFGSVVAAFIGNRHGWNPMEVVSVGMLFYARRAITVHGSAVWSLIATLMALAVAVINLLNTFGLGFASGFAGYFVGLLLLLVLAGLYFIRLIILSGPRSGP